MIRSLLTAILAFALPSALLAKPGAGTMIICTSEGLKSVPTNQPQRDHGPPCAHSFCDTRRKPCLPA